jgi:hypothetical protein
MKLKKNYNSINHFELKIIIIKRTKIKFERKINWKIGLNFWSAMWGKWGGEREKKRSIGVKPKLKTPPTLGVLKKTEKPIKPRKPEKK